MGTAKYVRDLPSRGPGQHRALYRVDPPMRKREWDNDMEEMVEAGPEQTMVEVSSIDLPHDRGSETAIFCVGVTPWGTLRQPINGKDHEAALKAAGYEMVT